MIGLETIHSAQAKPVDLKPETTSHVALCIKGFDGKGGRSAREIIAIDDTCSVSKRTGPLKTRTHFQKKQRPPQDWREDSDHPKRPSPEQVKCIARTARRNGKQQKPLAKPRQRSWAIHYPFSGVASHPFKPALHIILRDEHLGLSLAKANIYVHCIQCVAKHGTVGPRRNFLRSLQSTTA